MQGIPRIESIKILGVTINNRLSVCEHINQTISACGQSLFALKTLQAHGMQDRTLQVIYKSVTLSKLLSAATAWRGFALSQDIQRIKAFVKKSIRFGFYTKCAPTFVDLCCKSDTRLFKSITSDSDHILQSLLPAKIVSKYSLKKRAHYILAKRTTKLYDRNFIMRMLYGH